MEWTLSHPERGRNWRANARPDPWRKCPRPASGWLPGLFTVSVVVLRFALAACAQNSQFVFDAPGNLLVQTTESGSLPVILGQPQNQVVVAGGSASFSVVVADTRNLTYQWRFNGTNIGGANADALLVRNVAATNEGQYDVVLANGSGSVTSAPAMLWFDGNGNGMPDSWEMVYFGNLNQNATGDFDGDGVSNLREFLDGTNPTNAASAHFRLTVLNTGGAVAVAPLLPSYTNGQVVTLTGMASPPYTFRGWGGDLITTNNPASVTITNNKTVFAYLGPVAIIWTNSSGGDWNVASNWNPQLVPGLNDTVIITTPSTVTQNSDVECANLTLGAAGDFPTLSGTGKVTVDNVMTWAGGTMSGGGTTVIAPGGTLHISNPSRLQLSGRTLENGGTVLLTGTDVTLNSAVITNRAGALFNFQSAASLSGSSSRFDNVGTFRKSLSTATTTVGVTFNNYGSVDIQTGTLTCNNGTFNNNGSVALSPGTTNILAAGGSEAGPFTASANSMVQFTGNGFTPNFNLNPGTFLNGAGLYALYVTTINFNTNIALQNLDLYSTLAGAGSVTISNVMNWNSGATVGGSGVLLIAPGATLNLPSPFTTFLNGRSLENAGTVLWTGFGNCQVSGSVITNRAGALFNVQSAASLTGSSSRFDNAGTFRKSVNAGDSTVSFPFNNYSTVDLQMGGLTFSGGGSNIAGTITVSASTSLGLAGKFGATYTSDGASSITGAGNLTVNGGTSLAGLVNLAGTNAFNGGTANLTGNYICTNNTLNIFGTANFDGTGTVSPAVFNLGGTLGGANPVTVGSLMNWTGGTMGETGRTLIASGATMNMASPTYTITLTSRTLENAGTIVWTGGGSCYLNGAVITNRPGALFDAQNAASLFGASGRFDNAGTFRKEINSGTTTFDNNVSFNNYGTLDIQTGFVAANHGYASSASALLNCALGGTTAGTGYGQLQVANTVTLNGGLSVNLLGYSPATNDTFTVVSAGTRSGTFSSFSYPANRVAMQMSNSPSAVILTVTNVLPIPAVVLFPPMLSSSNALLTWTATSNVTYRLEQKGDVNSTNWSAIVGDVTTPSNTASKLDPLTISNRFYRVHVLP